MRWARSLGCMAWAIVVLAAPVAAMAVPPSASGSGPAVGVAAPSLDLVRISGAADTALDKLRGRVVVLDFWATWCGPCRAIMPELDRMRAAHSERDLAIVGVAREPPPVLAAFLRRSPVRYTIARDVGGTVARYGVRAIPTLVLVDRRGIVRRVFVGGAPRDVAGLAASVVSLLAEPVP